MRQTEADRARAHAAAPTAHSRHRPRPPPAAVRANLASAATRRAILPAARPRPSRDRKPANPFPRPRRGRASLPARSQHLSGRAPRRWRHSRGQEGWHRYPRCPPPQRPRHFRRPAWSRYSPRRRPTPSSPPGPASCEGLRQIAPSQMVERLCVDGCAKHHGRLSARVSACEYPSWRHGGQGPPGGRALRRSTAKRRRR
ncbi:hypothetical protein AGRA671_19325 [Agrobacterium radiobacter]